MGTNTLGLFLRHLALSEEVGRLGDASDRSLLAAYEAGRSQAAFTELMRRYGPRPRRRLLRRAAPGCCGRRLSARAEVEPGPGGGDRHPGGAPPCQHPGG